MRPRAQLVQPRVADVPDHDVAVVDDGDGEHAGHALPLGPERREPVDFVVGEGNGLAHAILDRAGLALEARAQHRQRGLGRLLARRLAADAVDDDEETARGVAVETILVDGALQTGMAVAGGLEHRADLHADSLAVSRGRPGERGGQRQQEGEDDEAEPEQPGHDRRDDLELQEHGIGQADARSVRQRRLDAVLALRAVRLVVAPRKRAGRSGWCRAC